MHNDHIKINSDNVEYDLDTINKGTWVEFRHNHAIPGNNKRNAEIQCIWEPPSNPYINDGMRF